LGEGVATRVSFMNEFSPTFDLKNMISTNIKDFSSKKKDPNSPDFDDKFQ
jgi:hypothetical protein